MSNNTLIFFTVLARVLAGVAVVGLGTYLIIHGHLTAGGWTIASGFVLAGISIKFK